MATDNQECNFAFVECKVANRVKNVMLQFNKITHANNDKSVDELGKESITAGNIKYDNVTLLNDFYHIKYQHHVNDNPNKFQIFYEYLFDNDNVLQCDINNCTSARQYYQRRNVSSD
eukprot:187762_1